MLLSLFSIASTMTHAFVFIVTIITGSDFPCIGNEKSKVLKPNFYEDAVFWNFLGLSL